VTVDSMAISAPIHVPYGLGIVSYRSGAQARRSTATVRHGRTACVGREPRGMLCRQGAAGPGRIDPQPLGPTHGPYSRSA